MNEYICPRCGARWPVRENHWLCDNCGGVLEFESTPRLDPQQIKRDDYSIWRYAHTLPVRQDADPISMGEGWTQLQPFERGKDDLLVKLEYTNPTGSYKDRGASVLVTRLYQEGIRDVVEDSSGNAGAALAAYTSRAGMRCRIFVPASHSTGKMRQISAYGAEMVPVPGTRRDTADAALEAGRATYYASHAHSPLFVEGCKTMAYELWEQLGRRAPGIVITPLGQGSILLGLHKGFRELAEEGLIDRVPRLVGVQAEACAPLSKAFEQGLDEPVRVETVGHTAAEGIKIADPVRGVELLRAVRETGGAFVTVAEDEILAAAADLAHHGYYVEPTSAVTLAGHRKLGVNGNDPAILILTGSGLKSR